MDDNFLHDHENLNHMDLWIFLIWDVVSEWLIKNLWEGGFWGSDVLVDEDFVGERNRYLKRMMT